MIDNKRIFEVLVRSRYRVALLIAFGIVFLRIQTYVNMVDKTILSVSAVVQGIEEETFLDIIFNPGVLTAVIINNWNTINFTVLSIGMALSLYTLYKNKVIYMLIGVSLVYSFYIIIIWRIYISQITINEILIKTLNSLSVEITLTAVLLSSLEFFRPLLTYRWISKRRNWSITLSILDITIYITTIIISAALIILFTQYILDTFTTLAEYSAPELRELINIYTNSHIGKVVILVMALAIITYFLYNLVEPILIYITRSRGQARDFLLNDYRKEIMGERGYVANVYKYLYLGLVIIVIASIPLFIAILREPGETLSLLRGIIGNLLLFKWDPYTISTDNLFSNLPYLQAINYLKERVESFIRFIMYLLF